MNNRVFEHKAQDNIANFDPEIHDDMGRVMSERVPGRQGLHPTGTPLTRLFDTGATRDALGDKLCYEGFLSPVVLKRFAEYMHEHRKQADGSMRDADNWQKGIPITAYRDSLIRHVIDAWLLWRSERVGSDEEYDALEDLLCAILFNAMGMLHEINRLRH